MVAATAGKQVVWQEQSVAFRHSRLAPVLVEPGHFPVKMRILPFSTFLTAVLLVAWYAVMGVSSNSALVVVFPQLS